MVGLAVLPAALVGVAAIIFLMIPGWAFFR